MSEKSSTAKKTWALIGRLKVAGPGVRAALRRARHEEVCGEFLQVATPILDEDAPKDGEFRNELERKWQLIVAALAHGIWDDQTMIFSQGGTALGAALCNANVSEMRALRVLHGHGETLHSAFQACVRQLMTTARPFDPVQLADLILSDGAPHEASVRRRIARDYYRAVDSAQATASTTKEAT